LLPLSKLTKKAKKLQDEMSKNSGSFKKYLPPVQKPLIENFAQPNLRLFSIS
jgi:hypothetical protein